MAYMIGGRGPIPNWRGEWVTNGFLSDARRLGLRLRTGNPRSFPGTYDAVRLKNEGVVGLYLRDDEPMPKGATELVVPELLEPKGEKGTT